MIRLDQRPCGRPTHYTRSFDERGQPHAGTPDSIDAADLSGQLPANWDDRLHEWQPAGDPGGAWVERIEQARAEKWAAVKAARARAQDGGVTVAGMRVQSDRASREELAAAARRLGRGGAKATIEWTLADNSRAVLGKAEAEAIDEAVTAHREAIHAQSRAKAAAIEAATTLAALAAVTLEFDI